MDPASLPNQPHLPHLVIVAGVSGAGKSTVGAALAARLGVPFLDADDLHPEANVAKMASGVPLTDADRGPWLARIGEKLVASSAADGVVIACSSLKVAYRRDIRSVAPTTFFVSLSGSRELLTARLAARAGHFMPAGLLDSQLAAFEPLAPHEAGADVSIDAPVDAIVTAAEAAVRRRA